MRWGWFCEHVFWKPGLFAHLVWDVPISQRKKLWPRGGEASSGPGLGVGVGSVLGALEAHGL